MLGICYYVTSAACIFWVLPLSSVQGLLYLCVMLSLAMADSGLVSSDFLCSLGLYRTDQEIQTYTIAVINALFLKAPDERRQVSLRSLVLRLDGARNSLLLWELSPWNSHALKTGWGIGGKSR